MLNFADTTGDTILSQTEKLLQSVIANPAGVRFADACKVAGIIGFVARGMSGSHATFAKPGEFRQLNFQDRNGQIKPYQGRQLRDHVIEYLETVQQ